MDIKILISITPIGNALKDQLLQSAQTSADKKYEVENFCWETILSDFEMKREIKIEEIMEEAVEGKRKYSEDEIMKIDEGLIAEIQTLMGGAQSQEQLQEVRNKLQTQTTSDSPANLSNPK
jgi:hypothetical protein